MRRVLMVQDCSDLRERVCSCLGNWFDVTAVETLREAWVALGEGRFDLVLTDVTLPDGCGFEFCARLISDESTCVPVVFFSSRVDLTDKVTGLSVGADDYITIPFEPMELRARLEARLRRSARPVQHAAVSSWKVGDLRFDLVGQRTFASDDGDERDLGLTPVEYKILHLLSRHPGAVFSRQELMKKVWGTSVHVGEDNVYTHISSLRRKLGARAHCIECLPRVGYRFRLAPSAAISVSAELSNVA